MNSVHVNRKILDDNSHAKVGNHYHNKVPVHISILRWHSTSSKCTNGL